MAPTTRSSTRKAASANAAVKTPSTSDATPGSTSDPGAASSAGSHINNNLSAGTTGGRGSAGRSAPGWVKSTTGAVLKTVGDDPNLLMDLNGWKTTVKDEEDMEFLKEALKDVPSADKTDDGPTAADK